MVENTSITSFYSTLAIKRPPTAFHDTQHLVQRKEVSLKKSFALNTNVPAGTLGYKFVLRILSNLFSFIIDKVQESQVHQAKE